jgi:hypothetical protein
MLQRQRIVWEIVMSGPKRGSGLRSNAYSESKCSNWQAYNPFNSEILSLPRNLKPSGLIRLTEDLQIPVFSRELHPAFVRPCSVTDICEVAQQIPHEFLIGLDAIHLLGGTSKQDTTAFGRLFRLGAYDYGTRRIYLHAFPRRCLTESRPKPPKPTIEQEYRRAGAEVLQKGDRWVIRFTESSLRRYYLYDVLSHEIGHHVERNARGKNMAAFERFANWFANWFANERRRRTGT